VFDVHACPGDLGRLAPQGFTVDDHDLTLYGRCKDCVAPADKSVKRKASDSGTHNHASTHTHRHRS
jgi:Fur family ferric uptake transcriptional regulator